MDLKVSSSIEAGAGKVVVSGEVDVSNAETVRAELQQLLESADVTSIEVDMSDVPYIDSTGIGVLVGASHRAGELNKPFTATGVQPNVARVFGMLGLDGIIRK